MQLLTGFEVEFIIKITLSVILGIAVGIEREFRGKPAGISTHSLVIGGSAIFAFISTLVDPASTTRIAAQIVSGVGFLGAGIILKSDKGMITNLTTAASIWFSASIGICIGFGFYIPAIVAAVFSIFVPRIPRAKNRRTKNLSKED